MKTTCNDGCIQSLCADGASPLCGEPWGTRLAQRRHSKAMVAARTLRHFNCCSALCRVAARQNCEGGCQSSGLRAGAAGVEGPVTTRNEITSTQGRGLGPMKSVGSRELGEVLLAFRGAALRATHGHCWAHSTVGRWFSCELCKGLSCQSGPARMAQRTAGFACTRRTLSSGCRINMGAAR